MPTRERRLREKRVAEGRAKAARIIEFNAILKPTSDLSRKLMAAARRRAAWRFWR